MPGMRNPQRFHIPSEREDTESYSAGDAVYGTSTHNPRSRSLASSTRSMTMETNGAPVKEISTWVSEKRF